MIEKEIKRERESDRLSEREKDIKIDYFEYVYSMFTLYYVFCTLMKRA